MKQIPQEMVLGASYSKQFTRKYKVELPKEIKNPMDAKFSSIKHDDRVNSKAVSGISNIINNFDKFVEKTKNQLNDLKQINQKDTINKFKNEFMNTEELIKIYESVLSKKVINPITYINAKRHFIIASIVINKIDINKIDISKILTKKIIWNAGTYKIFGLGVFIGLEPLFVTTIFSASERDNATINQTYAKLVDRYSHIVATLYPKEYIEAIGLNHPPVFTDVYPKFLKYLKEERNG